MERRALLRGLGATGLTATLGALAGCAGGSSTGTLAARVSDMPGDIADFTSLEVTVAAVWVSPAGGERVRRAFEEPATLDLTELTGEASALAGEVELETGEYETLQLDVTDTSATLEDGGSATVEVPGDAPLTFNAAFEIRADERTTFTADFTPVARGQAGSYGLQPVPSEIVVSYEDGSTETGTSTTATTTSG